MRKFGARFLAAVVASSLIVMPVMAAPSIDELKENKAEKQNEVNSLQEELTKIISKINGLEEDLVKKGEEIIQATDDLTAAEVKEREQYEAMKLRIKYMYEEGDTTALESLVTAENFSDLVNKAEYVQNVHDYDRDQLQEYVETKNEIANLKTTLEEDQKKLESLQVEYEDQKNVLDTTIEEKRAEVADLDGQIQAAVEAAAREAEERRRKEEEERQRQLAASNNNNSGNHQNGNNNNQNTGNSGNGGNSGNNSGNTGNTSNSGGGGQSNVGSGNASVGQAIVNAAYSQQGVPYVWGGTSPGVGLDCSGLVQYCHRVAGISIGRTSGEQGGGGVAVSSPQPGDVVCYSGHVGIYIGGGQMIHAPEPGDVVKIASVYGSPWYRRYW
ncbi:murein DD-endopeptidase MepH [Lachnospiraceae bacterium]|nr:murein DD-endopeptidase MepH [Lachnospiraceae bacterium]